MQIAKVVFIIAGIILTALILSQEGKTNGLGIIDNSYWAMNKGRTKEGIIVKLTAAFIAVFLIFALILSIVRFN